jgi:hypothetical protein
MSYSAKLGLTPLQTKKFGKGKSVRFTKEQLNEDSHTINGLSIDHIRKIHLAKKNNRGLTLQMTPTMIGANPLLFALLSAIAPTVIEEGAKFVGDLIKPKKKATGKGMVVPGNGLIRPGARKHCKNGGGLTRPGRVP